MLCNIDFKANHSKIVDNSFPAKKLGLTSPTKTVGIKAVYTIFTHSILMENYMEGQSAKNMG